MTGPASGSWTSHPHELAAGRAVRYGDGVFVTMALREGVLLDAGLQLSRLAEAADAVGLLPPADWTTPPAALDRLAAVLQELGVVGDHAVRLQWFAGAGPRGFGREPCVSRVLVDVGDLPPARRPSVVVLPDGLVPLPSVPRHKTCSALANVLCARQASLAGADAAVRVDGGVLLETDSANVFWLRGRSLFTPDEALPLYPGTVRARVIESAPALGLRVEAGQYAAAELAGAEAVLLVNSVRGLEFATSVDGVALGDPPPILSRLVGAVRSVRFAGGFPPGNAVAGP